MKTIFNGRYDITNEGVIYSNVTKNKDGSRKIIKPFLDRDGYKRTNLVTDKGRKKFRVCRLVAENYVENPDNKPVVNHIDGVVTNDYYVNLEWVTVSENTLHAIKMGLINLDARRCKETGRFL